MLRSAYLLSRPISCTAIQIRMKLVESTSSPYEPRTEWLTLVAP